MDTVVERCLADVVADHERQGGIDEDDVSRLVTAHRLDGEQSVALWAAVAARGIVEDSASSGDDGMDPGMWVRDDAIGALLRRAGTIPLLTAEEEVRLGRRIHLGAQAKDEDPDDPVNCRLIEDGLRAREHLVLANIRLAFSVARRYQNQGLDLEDVLHESVLGLIRAAEKFDHTRGYKFSTYATWWLRQSITRGLADKGRTIRLPVHFVEQMNRARRQRRRMEWELGRAPTLHELARALDMEPGAVQAVLDHEHQTVSLNTIVGDGVELEHLIPRQAESVEQIVEETFRTRDVHRRLRAMEHLSQGRAAEVLRRRHGIGVDQPQTLDEIGAHFGVTRERIRQIESKAYASARAHYFDDLRPECPA